jgi:hypothetical protein
MKRPLNIVLWAILLIFVLLVGSIIISDGAEILADVSHYVFRLFGRADLNPNNSRGFEAFVQLIIIAVFTGWAIKRFMNYFGK